MPHAVVIQPPLSLSPAFIDYPWFDGLGALQAASVLSAANWTVDLIDGLTGPGANLSKREEAAWLGAPKDVFLAQLSGLRADLILVHMGPFSCAYPGFSWMIQLAEHLTANSQACLVFADMVTGGMHYMDYDAQGFMDAARGVDYLLRYEGEALLGDLIRSLEAGEKPKRGIMTTGEPLEPSSLPPPAFKLMDCELFFSTVHKVLSSPWRPGPYPADPERTLPLITSRGCLYGCSFCSSNPGLSGKNKRSVRPIPWHLVQDWIGEWVNTWAIERLVILDELANQDEHRFGLILNTIERFGLRVEFPNGLRADHLQRDQVERLAGLTSSLKVSLESASPRVQKEVIGKRLDPAAVERVAQWCAEFGLPLAVHCLIGLPSETRDEIFQTLDLAAQMEDRWGIQPLLQFATPLPGTELHKTCVELGLLTEHPKDLAPLFMERGIIATDDFDPDFLAQAKQAFANRRGAHKGRKVIVNLTYRCNNRCLFCAVGDRQAQDAEPEAVLEALRRHRDKGFDLLDIDGGEPSLHPNLFQVIEQGKAMGYERVALITNGRRASYDRWATSLANTGVDEVLVSLHAPAADLHGKLTRVPDSYEQTVAGLVNLLRAMPSPEQVAVNTTLTGDNISHLKEMGRLLSRMGIRRWTLQLVTPFGRAGPDLMPTLAQIQEHLLGFLEQVPSGMDLQVINCPPCYLPGYEDRAMADLDKSERHMVFVGAQGENLFNYLAAKRVRSKRCRDCIWALCCPGEYVFGQEV